MKEPYIFLYTINYSKDVLAVADACLETIQRSIDYGRVNEKLNGIREQGIGYLKTTLLDKRNYECDTLF